MDELQKLYGVLVEQKLYTKSFEDFQKKYVENPESQGFLFDIVSSRELYTKSKEDFLGQYFPSATPVKKKDDTTEISEGSELGTLPLPTDSVSSASPSNQNPQNNQPVFTGAPTVENRDNIIREFEKSQLPAFQALPVEFQGTNKDDLELLDQFENIALDEKELAEVDEKFNEQKKGNFGFLGNIVKAVTTTPVFGSTPNPFFNPAAVLPKEREELIENAVNEKRVAFIEDIGKEKQATLQNLVKAKNFRADENRENLEDQINTIDNSLFSVRDEVEGIDGELSSLTNQRKVIENKAQNNTATQEDRVQYQSLIQQQKDLLKQRDQIVEGSEEMFVERTNILNQLEDSLENLGTMNQEIDLLRRNYDFFDNIKDRAGIGFADMFANLKYQFDRQKLRSERKNIKNLLETRDRLNERGLNVDAFNDALPPQYRVNTFEYNEEEFDAETEKLFDSLLASNIVGKEILNDQRDKLRPNISVEDINSFGDVVDFTVDGLADNTATIAQLAIPYFGQTTFLLNQQAGNEIELKGERAQKEERLSDINNIFDQESGSLIDLSSLTEDEKARLTKEKESLEKSLDNLSDTDILLASSGMAVSELAFSRLFGEAKRLKIGKRILNNATSGELKRQINRSTTQMFKDRLADLRKGSFAVLKDAAEEGFLDEFLTNFTQNSIRKYYLEDDSVGVFDNSIDAIAGGLSVGSVMSASPRVGGQFLSHFSNKKRRNAVYSNTTQITQLQQQLDTNTDLDEDLRGLMQNKINALILENKAIVGRTVESFDGLEEVDKRRLLSISDELVGLEISYDKLNNKNDLNNTEKQLLGDIEQRMNSLNEEKGDILNQPQAESTVTDQTQEFASAFGEQEDISQFVNGATKIKIGNTDVILGEKDGTINIKNISTPVTERGQGSARAAMEQITSVADEQGKDLRLNVVPLDDKTDADRLASFYETMGFVKDKDFDKDDGGIMKRSPQTKDSFSEIDSVIEQAQNTEATPVNTEGEAVNTEGQVNQGENVFVTNQNEYSVEVIDGQLEVKPLLGETTPSQAEINNVTNQYIEKTNFDVGQRATFDNKGNLTPQQINDVIVEESQNPQEVAQRILEVKDSNQDASTQLDTSKQSAIAQALKSSRVDDSNKDVTDLSKGFILGKNKTKRTIDEIREIAESNFGQEVEFQDVLDFLDNYSSASDFERQNKTTESFSTTPELESKFEELTGLKANEKNIQAVAGEQQSTTKQEDTDDGVPFQTESTQTKIEGSKLRSLIDRLEKTGLAKKVEVLSDQQMKDKLNEIGLDNNVQLQNDPESQEAEIFRQRKPAIELRRKLRKKGYDVENIVVSATEYGVSTYLSFVDKNENLKKFRISDHPVFNRDRLANEYHYDENTNIDELVDQVATDIENESPDPRAREKLAEEKWERIKDKFEGLTFKTLETNLNLEQFLKNRGGRPQNVFVQELDNGQFKYEWFGKLRNKERNRGQKPVTQPSIEFIENFNENDFEEFVQLQQDALEKGVTATPNGFVYKGVVYLNRDKVKADTPIHEFGHLWNSFAKNNHKAIYDRGIELVRETDYHDAVRRNPSYENLSEEQQLEEALAQAIGEKGIKILNESKKNKFSSWFKTLFTKIANGLGITSLSPFRIANLTLDKFTDLVGAELLSGQAVVDSNQSSATRQDTSEITNIEVVMGEARAATNAKNTLRKQINNKKSIDKAVKDALVKFIREQMDSKRFAALSKGEFSKILTAVKKPNQTKNVLLKQLEKVSDLIDRLDSQIINDSIEKILNRKLTKVESGRRKANLLTEEESIILDTVKKNIKGFESTSKPSEQKRAAITGKLAELFDQRDEIQRKDDPTRQDLLDEEAINISADILMGYRSDLNSNTKAFLLNGLESVESIYNQGRSQLIEAKEEKAQQYRDFRDELVEDTNPEELTQEKRKEQVEKDRKTIVADFARTYFNITKRKLIGSMDRLATVLSRKGGETRNDSAWVQFSNALKRQETIKERRIGKMAKSIIDAQKFFFGSRFKADKTLNTRTNLDIIKPDPALEEDQDPISTSTEFTYDELLSVWLNSKNEDNLAGLEANGFTEEVIQQIEDTLPNTVKEYGNWQVEEFYEDSWQDENEVYKRMNFHTLPKSENYAGRLYRDNADLKEDTEALNKGKGTLRTTAHGSQKLRTNNSKPIQVVPTSFLMKKHITDTSHYVAFAEIHQTLNKMINDKALIDAIDVTNPLTGDLAVKFLRFYKESILEKGLHRGYPIVNAIAKNINKATLALKTKIGLTQTISMVNAAVDMPSGISPTKFIQYYGDFPRLMESYKHIVKNSEYIKRRYGTEGFDQAITGLSTLLKTPMFSTGNTNLDARRKQIARFYKEGLDHAMINVRFGDKVGVMGALPVYNAWLDRFRRNNTEEVAREKAMKQFEDAVDRSQQTISSFGKSELQNDPIGRYFAMFATAPIQNQQNAMYHFNELRRGLTGKGKKGSYLKNIYGFLNYQFLQPMMYTYISTLMAGSIFTALGFGDEEPDDSDKKLLSAAILGNTSSIPFIGGAMQGTVEKFILDMDKSYGEVVNSALLSNSSEFMQKFYDIADAKSKEKEVEKTEEMIKELSALLIGMPNFASDTFFDWDDTYWNDDVDNWVKFYKALGYSDYVILQSLRQRQSREISDRKKEGEEKKWEKSIERWEKQQKEKKTEPLFKLLPEDKRRK